MLLHLASPNWRVEHGGGEHLRRFGLHYFVLASVLAHGLALLLKFDFQPFFPVDRGTSRLELLLTPARPPDAPRLPASPESINHPHQITQSNLNRETVVRSTQIDMTPTVQPNQPADARTLIERGKAMLNTGSRRQMVDPMFSPPAKKPAVASPIERATAIRSQTIEDLGDKLIRITTGSGRRYCLQGQPEVATRDIPTQVLTVPTNCP
jgi:hypothetical protein